MIRITAYELYSNALNLLSLFLLQLQNHPLENAHLCVNLITGLT